MKSRLAPSVLAALVLGVGSVGGLAAPGTVYMVLGSDTALWNVDGGIDTSIYHNHFSPDLFIQPWANAYQVINSAFRQQFADSAGNPLKLTWWVLVGSVYGQAENNNVPIINLLPLHLMQEYHGATLRQLGDELTLHYHTFYWSDYEGYGVYYWNEAESFHPCRADWDLALAQSLLEEGVFPVSFRSGWHYMDNEWQGYLNQLLPYSMDDDWPADVPWYTNQPIYNVRDWSEAPSNFVPFHPCPTNYQLPGVSAGWNVRSEKCDSVDQTYMNQVFSDAAAGTNEVVSLWYHLPESDFPAQMVRMDALAHAALSNYPAVPFYYCTAVEAMQRWQGVEGQSPPALDIVEQVTGQTLTLQVSTSKPIFQAQPFVAVKDIFAQYQIVPCAPAGANAWTALVPVPRNQIAKYGVAVADLVGNLTNCIVRYLPDDLFIDDLDPGYSEPAGQWISTTNAAWGIDARLASLASNTLVQASWQLPVTWTGPYNAFVQIPAIGNTAGQVQFDFLSAGSNLLSVFFPSPLLGLQWVYLGTPTLDARVTNTLLMTVSALGQTNCWAIADVVKLSPLTLPLPGFITNVQVKPGDTTACLTWRTTAPATGQAEFGLSPAYGSFSATNLLPLTQHVVTFTGLQPANLYYYCLESTAGELTYTYQAIFSTASAAPPAELRYLFSNGLLTLFWNGAGWRLQQANYLEKGGDWTDLPGPITNSPCSLTVSNRSFFRLSQ
jgi:hypothetical protein